MSGFDLRGKHQTPEEYVDQLRVILEHDCLGARKKECLFTFFAFFVACFIFIPKWQFHYFNKEISLPLPFFRLHYHRLDILTKCFTQQFCARLVPPQQVLSTPLQQVHIAMPLQQVPSHVQFLVSVHDWLKIAGTSLIDLQYLRGMVRMFNDD